MAVDKKTRREIQGVSTYVQDGIAQLCDDCFQKGNYGPERLVTNPENFVCGICGKITTVETNPAIIGTYLYFVYAPTSDTNECNNVFLAPIDNLESSLRQVQHDTYENINLPRSNTPSFNQRSFQLNDNRIVSISAGGATPSQIQVIEINDIEAVEINDRATISTVYDIFTGVGSAWYEQITYDSYNDRVYYWEKSVSGNPYNGERFGYFDDLDQPTWTNNIIADYGVADTFPMAYAFSQPYIDGQSNSLYFVEKSYSMVTRYDLDDWISYISTGTLLANFPSPDTYLFPDNAARTPDYTSLNHTYQSMEGYTFSDDGYFYILESWSDYDVWGDDYEIDKPINFNLHRVALGASLSTMELLYTITKDGSQLTCLGVDNMDGLHHDRLTGYLYTHYYDEYIDDADDLSDWAEYWIRLNSTASAGTDLTVIGLIRGTDENDNTFRYITTPSYNARSTKFGFRATAWSPTPSVSTLSALHENVVESCFNPCYTYPTPAVVYNAGYGSYQLSGLDGSDKQKTRQEYGYVPIRSMTPVKWNDGVNDRLILNYTPYSIDTCCFDGYSPAREYITGDVGDLKFLMFHAGAYDSVNGKVYVSLSKVNTTPYAVYDNHVFGYFDDLTNPTWTFNTIKDEVYPQVLVPNEVDYYSDIAADFPNDRMFTINDDPLINSAYWLSTAYPTAVTVYPGAIVETTNISTAPAVNQATPVQSFSQQGPYPHNTNYTYPNLPYWATATDTYYYTAVAYDSANDYVFASYVRPVSFTEIVGVQNVNWVFGIHRYSGTDLTATPTEIVQETTTMYAGTTSRGLAFYNNELYYLVFDSATPTYLRIHKWNSTITGQTQANGTDLGVYDVVPSSKLRYYQMGLGVIYRRPSITIIS